MLGSKLHHPEHDVRFEKISLKEAVGEALKNQSYFLIHHNFEIKEEPGRSRYIQIKDGWSIFWIS